MISLRNSLRPVNRLPPEVLTACATFVSDTDPRPIVSLTHVCRYWRRSITSNPRSWASIGSRWKRLVPLCLKRAGAVPLAVDITIPDVRGNLGFLEALMPHMARVAHLSLAGYSSIETVADELPSLFTSPTPDLTSLELQQTPEPVELFPPRTATVPPVFQKVSKLKSLHLTRTPLYPPLFGIPSLVELKLIGYTNPFNFMTFMEFLASNPNLETVFLDIGFMEGSTRLAPVRMVSLVRLRRLSITRAKPNDAKRLLSNISLPRGTSLEVSCLHWTSLGLCLPSPPTPIHRLLTPIIAIRIRASPREIHVFGSNGGIFSFRCPGNESFFKSELDPFPITSVREFHVEVASWTFTPALLDSLLTRLPALETLTIANAASWAAGTFDSLAGQPPLCPSLKTIAFFNCGFSPQALKEFGGVVAKRKGSEAAWLYRVVIVSNTRPLPDYTMIQQLRQHVPCVNVGVDDKLPDLA